MANNPDAPWTGDACSLVDEFRAGRRSPLEETVATLAAIEADPFNCVSFVDADGGLDAARRADVTRPFGGVPFLVKELDQVAGWPDTAASVPFANRVATGTTTNGGRIRDRGGATMVGLSTASEFGGVNVTRTELNGVTRNPWDLTCTPGGSSGGAAAAVAGGIVTIATAGDGGGSIRIPAGFTNLVGLKATFGRIPRSPGARYGNLTVNHGCVSRSVRDTARWFDVANGHDPRDPLSLPQVGGWEAGLSTLEDALAGLKVAVVSDWGGATVSPIMWDHLLGVAHELIADTAMVPVEDVDTHLPRMGAAWSISGMISIRSALGDMWPDCADQLTPEIRAGLELTEGRYGADARDRIERRRCELNEAMARIFDPADGVDLVITASNPDVAFTAEGPLPSVFGGLDAGAGNNGLLTFPANLHGNPAISVPAGFIDGLPVGLQIIGRHFSEQLLLDAAHRLEQLRPWPLVA